MSSDDVRMSSLFGPQVAEIEDALAIAASGAARYLASLLDEQPADLDGEAGCAGFDRPLPDRGRGAAAAVCELCARGMKTAVPSAGARYLDYATGGATPAAIAADWLTTAFDQNARFSASSPLATELEELVLEWIKQLCHLPDRWTGAMTSGATLANLAGLAAARSWWAQCSGRDAERDGLAGAGPTPVFAGGWTHPTTAQALAVLGLGREALCELPRADDGGLDSHQLARALEALEGSPAIVVCTAGDVDGGRFDPIAEVVDVCRRHRAWLHVDAAFGLMAAASPRTCHLLRGIEGVQSLASDAHKWLNVPYDSGFFFVSDGQYLDRVFGGRHAFEGAVGVDLAARTPENSRRARALAVWATLFAYGRAGYQDMVERFVDLAGRLRDQVDAAPDFERLAPTPLNVVAFRYRPPGLDEPSLDTLNARLGAEPGPHVGSASRHWGHVGFRPVFLNWRTTEADVDAVLPSVRARAQLLTSCSRSAH